MKYWLIVVASLINLSAQGLAQNPVPPPLEPSEILRRFSPPPVKTDCQSPSRVDPKVIKKWIEENPECNRKPIWTLLNIEGDFIDNMRNENCQTELQDVYLSAQKNRTKMLQIILADEARYLFFSQPETYDNLQSNWNFVGVISSHYQQYGPPDLRFEGESDHHWAVINELRGRGTGVLLRGESWYEISESGIKEVLSYPVKGHEADIFNITNRSFQAMPILIESDNTSILISFVVNYKTLVSAGIPLSRMQKAFYIRDEASGEFKLDEAQSEITIEELEAVYNLGLDEALFVKYNRAALRKIIARAKPEQKEAWRKFLQESRPLGYSVLEELFK